MTLQPPPGSVSGPIEIIPYSNLNCRGFVTNFDIIINGEASRCPTSVSASQTNAAVGDTINITGRDAAGDDSRFADHVLNVYFASASGQGFQGIPVSFNRVSGSTVSVVVPAGAITGSIFVQTSGTCANLSTTQSVIIGPRLCPTFSFFDKQSVAPGETLTVNGSNFQGKVSKLRFTAAGGGIVEGDTTVLSDTQFRVTVPLNAVNGPIIIIVIGESCSNVPCRDLIIIRCPVWVRYDKPQVREEEELSIYGSDFEGITEVRFPANNGAGYIPVTITSDNYIRNTETGVAGIHCPVPRGAIRGRIILIKLNCRIFCDEIIIIYCPVWRSYSFSAPSAGSTDVSLDILGDNLDFTTASGVEFTAPNNQTVNAGAVTAISGGIRVRVPPTAISGPIIIITIYCGRFPFPRIDLCPLADALTASNNQGRPGDRITITGSRLNLVTGVIFTNNVNAVTFNASADGTQLTVTVPVGAQTGPIRLRRANCPDIVTSTFTVRACPVVTGISPNPAAIGEKVTITGSGFDNVTRVSFPAAGPTAYTPGDNLRVISSTQLEVNVPQGAVDGDLVISAPNCPDAFINLRLRTHGCLTAANVHLAPNPINIGETLSITSSDIFNNELGSVTEVIFQGANGPISVKDIQKIGTIDPAYFIRELRVVVPAGAITGRLILKSPGCQDVQTEVLTINNSSCPIWREYRYNSLSLGTGDTLTINGEWFDGVEVYFTGENGQLIKGTQQPYFLIYPRRSIKVTVPVGAVTGSVYLVRPGCPIVVCPVIVINGRPGCPIFRSYSNDVVSVGDRLTIYGDNFDDVTQVLFTGAGNTTVAANVDGYVRGDFIIGNVIGVIVRVPQGAVTGCIVIVTPTCRVVVCTPCTVRSTQPPCPIFLGYSAAQVRAGDTLSLFGYNFDDVSEVRFTGASGTFTASGLTPLSGGSGVRVTVPAEAISGSVVVITRGGCRLVLPYIIIIIVTPSCPTVELASVPKMANVNDALTINGSGLGNGNIKALFNSASGAVEAPVTPISNTQLRIVVPPNAISGPLIIIVGDGCGLFIIEIVIGGGPNTCPSYASVDKLEAVEDDALTITGSNFVNHIDQVLFNSVTGVTLPVQPTSVTDTQLRVVVPRGAVSGPIIIIPKGTCQTLHTPVIIIKTPPINSCPVVASINPMSGKEGDALTFNGTNFAGVTSVLFSNNVSAAATANADGTRLTTSVPSGAASGPIIIRKQGCPDAVTGVFTVQQVNCVTVAIAGNLTASAGGSISVPITVGDLTGKGVIAYDFTLTYDASVLRPQTTAYDKAGTLSDSLTITPNTGTPGRVTISAFGAGAVSGGGTLLKLKFDVIGANSACSALAFSSFTFNDGTPCATPANGRLCVASSASISGAVTYYGGGKPAVANVTVSAAGTPAAAGITGSDGKYQLPQLGSGPYTVTLAKTDEVNGISSLDAARVAQAAAGLITLTDAEKLAADASDNGAINALDAALIAQTVAGLPNTGKAGTWKFLPPNRNYTALAGDKTNEDYQAVLVGDVNGSWRPSPPSPISVQAPRARQSAADAERTADTVRVILPQLSAAPASSITVPITVGDLTGKSVIAYDLVLTYDATVLQPQASVATKEDTLSSAMSITPNALTPGRLVISAFGTTPLSGQGTLLNLRFNVIGGAGAATPLTLTSFTFNDGDPQAELVNGRVTISGRAPALTSLNPVSITAGSAGFTLTLTGGNFVNGSTVRWNGADRSTAFVSTTQLTATIPASDIAIPSSASVTVFNPVPSGGVSNTLSFAINSAVASVSAANFLGTMLASESIVAAFGVDLATQTLSAPATPLPTTLAGTTLRVRDNLGAERLAQLFFVSPNQVNYLMPASTAPGAALVTITNSNGKASAGTTQITTAAPGLFAANANGQGIAAAVAFRIKANGAQSFEPVARFDAVQNKIVPIPIDLGPETDQVFLILYGTGVRFRSSLATVAAILGGTNAPVSFAGIAPGFIGLDQINLSIPRSLIGRGDVNVALMVDGQAANTVQVNIK